MPETLTFSVVNWKESDAECTFTVVNSGFGYTTQLQNKYYHTSFGLFILTNNTEPHLHLHIRHSKYKA